MCFAWGGSQTLLRCDQGGKPLPATKAAAAFDFLPPLPGIGVKTVSQDAAQHSAATGKDRSRFSLPSAGARKENMYAYL